MRRPSGLGVVVTLLVLFLYLPLAVAVLFAFNAGSNLSWPPEGLSIRWFSTILRDDEFLNAFAFSAKVATITALMAGVIGLAAAFAFARRRSWAVRLVEALSRLPVMLPPLFIGVALLVAMTAIDYVPDTSSVIAGHLVYVIPYVLVVVTAALRGIDLELEQAARDLGAGPLQTLRRITLPMVGPAVLGAALLAFAFSFDEVLITNFTVGTDPTLPLYVFSKLRRTVDPSINAVATILLCVPWVILGVAALFLRRSVLIRRRSSIVPTTFEGDR